MHISAGDADKRGIATVPNNYIVMTYKDLWHFGKI